MRNSKFYSIIGILIVILLVLVLWPIKKKEEEVIIKNISISEPQPEFFLDSPQMIDWFNLTDKQFTSVSILSTERYLIPELFKNKIPEYIKGKPVNSDEYFNYDDNRSEFEFSKNITSKKQIQRGSWGADQLSDRLNQVFTQINDTDLEIKIEKTTNKEFLYPWWINTDKTIPDVVEISASFFYKNIPIRLFNGFMINANYFTNGDLVKMKVAYPFGKIVKMIEEPVINLSSLKNRNINNFKIWKIEGNSDYELSGEQEKINRVIVDSYNLGYIYDVKSKVVWPYYFIEGKSNLSTGEIKVTLITSAINN